MHKTFKIFIQLTAVCSLKECSVLILFRQDVKPICYTLNNFYENQNVQCINYCSCPINLF